MVTSGLSISIALMLTPAAEPRSFSSPPSGSFCEPLLSSGLATVVAPHHLSPFNLQYYKIDSFGTYFFIRNMPFLPQYFLSHSFIWRCFILRSPICCRTVGCVSGVCDIVSFYTSAVKDAAASHESGLCSLFYVCSPERMS